ncbi:MAG: CHC2 zinc finger domain-containing protein, partial [Chloroflexota bacterium]
MKMLTKEDLKERVAIDAIVDGDIGPPVRKSGAWQLYFCPFHENIRTPALGVNVETGTFKCFSCGAHGDIFTWRMLREGETFQQALKWFREKLGIQGTNSKNWPRLNAKPRRRTTANDHPPSAQWQARGRAFAQYAQEQLWKGGAGLQLGLDELFRRGLKAET